MLPNTYQRAHTDWADEVQPDLDIFDETNPYSLVNMLPVKMKEYLLKITPEILMMGEEKLSKAAGVTVTEKRLRHGFWIEYNYAQLSKRQMSISNIVNGVVRKEQWWHHVCKNQWKLAYIMTPPPDAKIAKEELLTLGLEQMRDILEQPHMITNPKTGKTVMDSRVVAQKIKIYEVIANQVHGAPIQRLESKSLHVNVDAPAPAALTLEDLERQIKAAEASIQLTQKKREPHVRIEREAQQARQEGVPEVWDESVVSPEVGSGEGEDHPGELRQVSEPLGDALGPVLGE